MCLSLEMMDDFTTATGRRPAELPHALHRGFAERLKGGVGVGLRVKHHDYGNRGLLGVVNSFGMLETGGAGQLPGVLLDAGRCLLYLVSREFDARDSGIHARPLCCVPRSP